MNCRRPWKPEASIVSISSNTQLMEIVDTNSMIITYIDSIGFFAVISPYATVVISAIEKYRAYRYCILYEYVTIDSKQFELVSQ